MSGPDIDAIMPELRSSLIARAIRQSLRLYVPKMAETTLPEGLAVDVERALAAHEKIWGTMERYYERQIEWSRETFGPALRTGGLMDHIRKELREIEQNPHDLSEWVDVIILAMDGFWRHGGKASDLMPALFAKQRKNMARAWPDWRTMSEDAAIEHNRDKADERA